MKVLYRDKSEQHELTVYDTRRLYGEQGKFRVLQFSDDAVQGALDLERPSRIVLEYPRAILHLMERNDPQYHRVFVVGHGIGTIPAYLSDRQVKVAELDAEVVRLSRHFFGYTGPDVRIGDGRELLKQEESGTYDYIVIDAFSAAGTPEQFTNQSFFALVKDKLDADGAVLLNVFGRSGNDKLVNAIYTTLGTQFTYTRAFALPAEPNDVQNRILIGSHRPIDAHIKQMAGFVEQCLEEGYMII
ncbi:spermidine synthase [Paenibacillus silvae]|uniref:spermidine synthase n=1 Tax=Paenibacillus silvae TaxID=1325358 RepID=UPI0020049B15|nr:fused MFS/spermidine synthase [Paenibacillus silvae]MCK6074286.1 fused MFS/spermidine synthase [Paenibacillus silvae]MCK6148236.1 fused MFS/spermidine synthase [Paenibacillus silvae]MCK6266536.1 fused MFS/spermidine synthase [Paenibacillus silvae]